MASNNANPTPIFTNAGNFTPVRIAGANTASDGTTPVGGAALSVLVIAATDGTRVDGVRFRNSQTTAAASSAMVHRIFLTDTAAANPRLIGEVATPTATRTATAIGATSIYVFDQPIIMKSGQRILVGQSVYAGPQDQFDACAFAGDY